MNRPAVFFDRDNTLIACDEYLGEPAKVSPVDGAADAVARARQLGFATVVISNQSGVARGYFDEAAVHAVNQRLDEMLKDANPNATIDRHEFCPFHPEASIEKYRQDSPMRKPGPGMIKAAAEALSLDLSKSWVIGDAPRDIEAGHAAGCRTILFTHPELKSSPAAMVEQKVAPDFVCASLKDAMEYIEKNSDLPKREELPAVTTEKKSENEGALVDSTEDPQAPLRYAARRSAAEPTDSSAPDAPSTSVAKLLAHAQPHSTARLESLANDILHELRRQREVPTSDFSVSKLMAGVVQVIVLFVLFLAFLNRNESSLFPLLLLALTLQTMTIALLIMGRQK